MAQIKCQDLVIGYDGKSVISGVSFQVNKGDYLCIVGENGSGKSTLMKSMLSLKGLMSGKISFSEGVLANEIGYLPQQTQIQKDFPASVREIVQSGCLNRCGLRPFYNVKEKKSATEAMEQLGIISLEKKCYRELSGGQQQRVLLARALCATGKILLLDEPVAGLDPNAINEMYEIIGKLNHSGISIIMISHDVDMSIKQATHVLHIGNQSEYFYGTKQEYLEKKKGDMKLWM